MVTRPKPKPKPKPQAEAPKVRPEEEPAVRAFAEKHRIHANHAAELLKDAEKMEAFHARRRLRRLMRAGARGSCLRKGCVVTLVVASQVHGGHELTGRLARIWRRDLGLSVQDGGWVKVPKLNVRFLFQLDDGERIDVATPAAEEDVPAACASSGRRWASNSVLRSAVLERPHMRCEVLGGHVLTGQVTWFGPFEFGFQLSTGADVVVMRHALTDFEVIEDGSTEP